MLTQTCIGLTLPSQFLHPSPLLPNPEKLHTFVCLAEPPGEASLHPSNVQPFILPGITNMAKDNLFLGTARGKVGSVVFSRRNGTQITRVKVNPANPRTTAQTIQRLAFSTAVKTAKALNEIIDHSFEGVKYGQTSVNHFTKEATRVIKAYATAANNGDYAGYAPILSYGAQGLGAFAPVLIASGQLSNGNIIQKEIGSSHDMGLAVNDWQSAVSGMSAITVADFQDIFGIPFTDQMTFVYGWAVTDPSLIDIEAHGVDFHVRRLNFKTDLASTDQLFTVSSGSWTLVSTSIDYERSSSDIEELSINSAGEFVFQFGDVPTGQSADAPTCSAFIASRFVDGTWQRSNARLTLPSLTGATADTYRALAWNDLAELVAASVPAKSGTENEYLNKKKMTA